MLAMAGLTLGKTLAIAASLAALAVAVACGSAATLEPSPTPTPGAAPSQNPLSTPTPPATPIEEATPTGPPQATATPDESPLPPLRELLLERVYEDLTFEGLTNLVQVDGRMFVTEQTGRVMSLSNDPQQSEAAVYLDIRDRVNKGGNEEGLLGLAFDPDFESNGHFYVYYSAANPRRSVVSRFTAATANAATAKPNSEVVIMEIRQPYPNHNGGQLAFGPDGMLYIALGDGGPGGDHEGNGQDVSTLLGSILRIDVSGLGPGEGYRIPPDNPFVGIADANGLIWAYGFRNPWRFSFDRLNGDLWVGDVGQNSYEEVDLVVRGGNYGWNTMEGGHCFSPKAGCDASGTRLPVIEYGADKGCSVIGGYVYRGAQVPSLTGVYVYGDYCSGEIHGLRTDGSDAVEHKLLVDSGLMITSFGEDEKGEIYVLSQNGGIYRLIATPHSRHCRLTPRSGHGFLGPNQ